MASILLFTDFGTSGPYVGQVQSALKEYAPDVPSFSLLADAPKYAPRAASYLLASLVPELPSGSVVLSVVDPGVGTSRLALAAYVDERWLVGPDNGLLDVALARSAEARLWEILWRPEALSATFHGRDLFAPVAAVVAQMGRLPEDWARPLEREVGDPGDLWEVIYIDHYGNAMTGIRPSSLDPGVQLSARGAIFSPGRTFADVAVGEKLWYANSNALVELAVNQGDAAQTFGLGVGSPVEMTPAN